MNLRCPECCSEETAPIDRGRRHQCGNCGARFAPGEALLTAAEAREAAAPYAQASPSFRFDRDLAARDLIDPDGALWPVNAYSDADELNLLLEAAQDSGVISADPLAARLYIYPLSISEPAPLLVVAADVGPALLGHSLKLRERDDEDPIAFTLRLLEETTSAANALAAEHRAAADCLDRIAASGFVPESDVRDRRVVGPSGARTQEGRIAGPIWLTEDAHRDVRGAVSARDFGANP